MILTSLMNLLIDPHKKSLKFSGRSSRSEFWLFQLQYILIILLLVFGIAPTELSLSPEYKWFNLPSSINEGIYSLISIIILYLFIPAFSVLSRRLHDTDRSFFWALLLIIPLGNLVLIVFFCLRGTDGDNRYGSDPLL